MHVSNKGLRHTITGALIYAASNICALGFSHHGKMDWSVSVSMMLITSLWSVGVLYAICFDKTKGLRDPFLTGPQVVFGLSLILWITFKAPGIGPAILLFSAIPFLFASLGLRATQFTALTATTTIGYICVLLFHEITGKADDDEWLGLAVLLVAIPTISMLCGYISTIRNNLGLLYKELSTAHRKVSELIDRDELTGLYTRRYIKDRAQYLANLAIRGDSFCVCMIDVDHFKRINDTYGHPVGDLVLKDIAAIAGKNVRNVDVVGRWGGEEFIVLVHGNNLAAESIAARIRNEVSGRRIEALNGDQTTVSIGISQYSPGETLEFTIKRADDALYAAKHNGRNCIVLR